MKSGTLYIVGTPIGNLEDITFRALRVLKEVSLIAAEDTRHTQKLLQHYGVSTRLTSYHDHNKEEKAAVLIAKLKEGTDVALVSDAGTPVISDPGYYLIQRAIGEAIPVSPLPGPTAPIAALSVSGLPTDAFTFEGFLPSRKTSRRKKLEALSGEQRTLIFFEAPHRVFSTLQDMLDILGDRRIALGRELTKIHEEVLRGTVSQILSDLKQRSIKGEMTLILEGARTMETPEANLSQYLEDLRKAGFHVRDAAALAARDFRVPRKTTYHEALKIWTVK